MPELPARYTREPAIEPVTPDLRERLDRIWEGGSGLRGWFGTVDHKILGIRYIITAFVFLLLGGIEALAMRVQLAGPDQTFLTPEQYNELFSMHGITMIFLYALPILSGFSIFLFPLLIGARDMAFPRLNAFSWWVFLFSGLFIYASFFAGAVPNAGWFNYPPYALKQFNPGMNMDFYALGMILLGISTTTGSINFVITFLRLRAPGMSFNRTPVILWGTTTISVGNLLAVPAVSLAFFLLWLDRQYGTHFYGVEDGGKPLLWQHLFWLFAHPWVYIIVLPAMGMVSDILPVFCRRPLVGYSLVVLATVATMILGFGVWVHHMFATGIPFLSLSYFSGASFIITIPSAVSVFAWVATIWWGRPVIKTAFLYASSFIVMFVIAGVSGVMTASVPADLQLHDTYFVLAHLHYTIVGINLFGVLAGLYFWFPKMTGRMLDERLGRIAFWCVFLGFNLAFLPMHWTGLMGMPRRIYTYPDAAGWGWLNMLTTVGSFVMAAGILLVLINVAQGRWFGRRAAPNPWDAPTLEWAVSSPPPAYNFAVQPVVAGRHPLWEGRLGGEATGRSSLDHGPVLDRGKEQLVTSMLDGEPLLVSKVAEDSLWPFFATLAMTGFFAALLYHWTWTAAALGIVTLLCGLFWNWPRASLGQVREVRDD
ncbi:cytochrome ubiquinol oxidase subunit I [Roseovarius spongiae]|uniref:Cytochrome ubiquinol oxidase subunit I n=1 Tax=Roseovarius spongiae TaxID=2320272 RepID=A0A3A8AQL6_9RHOB|nr:cbb3-type cytochrome c oxidase subunit I [Roseovarius spongiae]RKF12662.1 cytochrome ubiquinol oxidase subunit I [Roseovarius spongiae]